MAKAPGFRVWRDFEGKRRAGAGLDPWLVLLDAEVGPEERLAVGSHSRRQGKKFEKFLPAFMERSRLFWRERAKPRPVPARGHDRVTEVAERDHVCQAVGTSCRARHDVVGVEHAVWIAHPIPANLALMVVALLHEPRQCFPVPRRVIRHVHRASGCPNRKNSRCCLQ